MTVCAWCNPVVIPSGQGLAKRKARFRSGPFFGAGGSDGHFLLVVQDLAEDRLQNAAVPVVFDVHLAVEAENSVKFDGGTVLLGGAHLDPLSGLDFIVEAEDVKGFFAGQAEGLPAVAVGEL